jgi:hypothetical protein
VFQDFRRLLDVIGWGMKVMFRRVGGKSRVQTIVLAAALLAYPCGAFAQHGGGGGHIGGGVAGGEGLSGGNHATGVDAKDDLRDFHEIMAVQASTEQKAAYAAMVKSTAGASAELKILIEQIGKENNVRDVASIDKTLEDAVETARTLNKKFLEGFSEAQKSGLKEITKRLNKADSELAQPAKALDQAVETNAAAAQMANAAQGLERALTSFQHEQTGLGEEMSITTFDNGQESAFNLPPVKNSINFANQPMVITTSGVVSKSVAEGGQNIFAVELTEDMSDLQLAIADVLRARLNKADACGERIAIQTAALTGQQAAGVVAAQLHYERWTCTTMFGRENMNEMVEGNASIEVKLIPAVAEDGSLQLVAQMGRVDAEGLVGESLRSGAAGERLRDKIMESVLTVMRQGGDFKAALPAGARGYATLRRARFQGTGSGRLIAILDGEIQVSNDNLAALTTELQRSSQSPPALPQLMTR